MKRTLTALLACWLAVLAAAPAAATVEKVILAEDFGATW